MGSPAIQTAFADPGGTGTGTATFAAAQSAGHTNVVCLRGDPFSTGPVAADVISVVDSAGNVYTQQNFANNPPAFGVPGLWMYTCVGIKGSAAGNVITVTWNPIFFLQIIAIEYPQTGPVRASNANWRFGGGTAPISTTLAGTQAGDLVVMTSWAANVAVSGAGTVGANAANVVYYDSSAGHNFVAQDGLGDGSSPMTTVCGAVVDDLFDIVSVAFAPPVSRGVRLCA